MVLSEALLGDAPHSCSESMATLTILPAAAQQQVQLLQEQGEEKQDAPKQHICQGRFQRHASLVCPLLPFQLQLPHQSCLLDGLFVHQGSSSKDEG